MIARLWKTKCPARHKRGFLEHLQRTGIDETTATPGFQGAQVLARDMPKEDKEDMVDMVEIALITYWDGLESIKAFAGDDIDVARLYPGDERYELDPDDFVTHYAVVDGQGFGAAG